MCVDNTHNPAICQWSELFFGIALIGNWLIFRNRKGQRVQWHSGYSLSNVRTCRLLAFSFIILCESGFYTRSDEKKLPHHFCEIVCPNASSVEKHSKD